LLSCLESFYDYDQGLEKIVEVAENFILSNKESFLSFFGKALLDFSKSPSLKKKFNKSAIIFISKL
jgi:hypothetical protein